MINVKKNIWKNKVERTLPIHDYMTLEAIGRRNAKARYIKKIRKSEKDIVEMMTNTYNCEVDSQYKGFDYFEHKYIDVKESMTYRLFKEWYSIKDLISHKLYPVPTEKKNKLSKNYQSIIAMQIAKKEQEIATMLEKVEENDIDVQESITEFGNYKKSLWMKIDHLESIKYLQYAPKKFRNLWRNSILEDRTLYKKHVEFTVDRVNIIWLSGFKYEFEKDNLSCPDIMIQNGSIDKYLGSTYFNVHALVEYAQRNNISIPTTDMYEDILAIMPAWYSKKQDKMSIAWKQLFAVFWWELSWCFHRGKHNHYGIGKGKWYFMSATTRNWLVDVLVVDSEKAQFTTQFADNQFPVRALRTPK